MGQLVTQVPAFKTFPLFVALFDSARSSAMKSGVFIPAPLVDLAKYLNYSNAVIKEVNQNDQSVLFQGVWAQDQPNPNHVQYRSVVSVLKGRFASFIRTFRKQQKLSGASAFAVDSLYDTMIALNMDYSKVVREWPATTVQRYK